jgi:hypothetical protein
LQANEGNVLDTGTINEGNVLDTGTINEGNVKKIIEHIIFFIFLQLLSKIFVILR